jgi:hypothetical protein
VWIADLPRIFGGIVAAARALRLRTARGDEKLAKWPCVRGRNVRQEIRSMNRSPAVQLRGVARCPFARSAARATLAKPMKPVEDVDEATRDDLLWSVRVAVQSGFAGEDDIFEEIDQRVEDWLGEPHPGLSEELSSYARRLLDEQRAEESRWASRTMNDAIDDAFGELNENGIVALQNAGYTMSDGWSDANELAAKLETKPRGAAFYHGQDMERAIDGAGLHLAFGAYVEGAAHEAASRAVGREVCETLARHGVTTEWDGSVERRIRILPFEWRKRRWTKAAPR